eukprot:1154336-Pelagomonas_calceolata.AAC.1
MGIWRVVRNAPGCPKSPSPALHHHMPCTVLRKPLENREHGLSLDTALACWAVAASRAEKGLGQLLRRKARRQAQEHKERKKGRGSGGSSKLYEKRQKEKQAQGF